MAGSNRRCEGKKAIGNMRLGAIAILGVAGLVVALVVLNMPQLVQAQLSQLVDHRPHALRFGARPGARGMARRPSAAQLAAVVPGGVTSGIWTKLNNPTPFTPESAFLLTDGRILAQDGTLTNVAWWTLTPDTTTGSYQCDRRQSD